MQLLQPRQFSHVFLVDKVQDKLHEGSRVSSSWHKLVFLKFFLPDEGKGNVAETSWKNKLYLVPVRLSFLNYDRAGNLHDT